MNTQIKHVFGCLLLAVSLASSAWGAAAAPYRPTRAEARENYPLFRDINKRSLDIFHQKGVSLKETIDLVNRGLSTKPPNTRIEALHLCHRIIQCRKKFNEIFIDSTDPEKDYYDFCNQAAAIATRYTDRYDESTEYIVAQNLLLRLLEEDYCSTEALSLLRSCLKEYTFAKYYLTKSLCCALLKKDVGLAEALELSTWCVNNIKENKLLPGDLFYELIDCARRTIAKDLHFDLAIEIATITLASNPRLSRITKDCACFLFEELFKKGHGFAAAQPLLEDDKMLKRHKEFLSQKFIQYHPARTDSAFYIIDDEGLFDEYED